MMIRKHGHQGGWGASFPYVFIQKTLKIRVALDEMVSSGSTLFAKLFF